MHQANLQVWQLRCQFRCRGLSGLRLQALTLFNQGANPVSLAALFAGSGDSLDNLLTSATVY